MTDAIRVLANIARAYHNNDLDDEGRKYTGGVLNVVDPSKVPLLTKRGGATLLTLKDCLDALEQLAQANLGFGGFALLPLEPTERMLDMADSKTNMMSELSPAGRLEVLRVAYQTFLEERPVPELTNLLNDQRLREEDQ